jgi:hypothetical protein
MMRGYKTEVKLFGEKRNGIDFLGTPAGVVQLGRRAIGVWWRSDGL